MSEVCCSQPESTTVQPAHLTRRQFLGMLCAGAVTLNMPDWVVGLLPMPAVKPRQGESDVFRVLSLNVWGVPTAMARAERMAAIGRQVSTMDLDVVALQEVFDQADRETLLAHIDRAALPYDYYFASGLVGSGLMILARHPIVDASFHRYRLSSRPERILEGDFYAGKGIGLARLQTPSGLVDVYNTHVLAQYKPDAEDEYPAHRASNLYEAARFIDAGSTETPAILCGDLNVRPDQLGYRLITDLAVLTDTFAQANPGDPGYTYVPDNPYADEMSAQRIDYVLVQGGSQIGWEVQSAAVAMNDRPPGEAGLLAYSDHYGVLVSLRMNDVSSPAAAPEPQAVNQSLDELSTLLDQAINDAEDRNRSHLVQAGIGLAAAPAVNLAGRRLQSRAQKTGRVLRYLGTPLATVYTAFHGALSLWALPDERQALTELARAVQTQLRARRAFNGIEW